MAKLNSMTAGDLAKKQINAVNGAVAAYKAGVQAVKTAPGSAAAAQRDAYLAGVTRNVDKWAQRVGAVTLQQWMDATLTKGAQRLGPGITAATQKITAFWTRWMPTLQSAMATVHAMPKSTFEERLTRMTQMATILHDAAMGR
ncbi:MAG: hypothetical protein KGL39_57435 [Patescibacteria group bacterium]|nr:hypothetical protein [Patescibacteria group bacterium]